MWKLLVWTGAASVLLGSLASTSDTAAPSSAARGDLPSSGVLETSHPTPAPTRPGIMEASWGTPTSTAIHTESAIAPPMTRMPGAPLLTAASPP